MNLLSYVLEFAMIFPAIILHEVAHGYMAYRLGDTTAKDAGRLTLNPIAHIDIMGTIILPVTLLIISNGAFFFGYAKPVPINPWRFKNQRTGMALTGGAGPATNIGLAIIVGLFARFLMGTGSFFSTQSIGTFEGVLLYFTYANLVLAFFNLVPIPPLDGSRLVQAVLPDGARNVYHRIEPYGFLILVASSWLIPGLFNTYLSATVNPIFRLITGS